ncbi:MAG: dimethyladenosine transferase, rRNA (adenine1518-N6/adenine1519-N6)-dimethyltransferase [Candidatus Parcubacteria bacterium]
MKNQNEYNFEAKKSLGQNFLHAPHIIGEMVYAARAQQALEQGMYILEVGPGKGALTEALLESGAHVIAIEKDDRAIPFLQEKFATAITDGKLELIHGDILDIETIPLPKNDYIVIANIPYYITGELLRMFLENEHQPKRMVLMVQKEVADRIVTRGDNGKLNSKESILSISIKAYGEPKYIVTVPAKNFRPEPNVDSAVILIDNISNTFFDTISDEKSDKMAINKAFFALVKKGFAHKRKVLIGNLSEYIDRELLEKVWKECGLSEKVRAEEISLEIWGKMLKILTAFGIKL